jgi:hypothetical protein
MTLYVKCTKDKYQLPEMVCDSVKELAEKTGVRPGSIASMISKGYGGYYKVKVSPIWYPDNDGGMWTYADNGRVIHKGQNE